MPTALEQVRALYRLLDERDQLSILCDLASGGHKNLDQSDAFIDALMPVDDALTEAWASLEAAAEEAASENGAYGVGCTATMPTGYELRLALNGSVA